MIKFIFNLLIFIIILPANSFAQGWNMNLLGSYNYSVKANDIWGWADPNGNEYALVGLNDGFSVVNISNPANPVEEFYIPDLNSTWRDIKTWGHYAYVTTEADAGLLIVDLNDMTGGTYWHVTNFTNPNGSSVEFTAAHNIYIDENGIAYIFGASSNTGSSPADGAIFLDVDANPTNPIYLGEWNDEYIHDGMTRGDTLYAGCIYAGLLYVIDVSNKSAPVNLGSTSTPNNFTHNAWVSDNGNFVFTTDEQSDAYLAAYDISDPNNIQEVDRIQSNPGSNSIPHNTHVDGNFLITSYYRDGTTVHDITYPNNMIQVAYYDSYSGSGNGFDGCWGTYPFLPSGLIISSDRNSNNGQGKLLIYSRDFKQACYIQGTIIDCISQNPINGATIQILNTNINETTNLLGDYQTAVIDSNSYQVVINAQGYNSDTVNIILQNGIMTILNHSLCPPCAPVTVTNSIDICDNTYHQVGSSIYVNSGTYTDTLSTLSGCDSIIITNLTISPTANITVFDSICEGDYITVGNNIYNQSGIYIDTLVSINGCDSVVNTNLFIKPLTQISFSYTICAGDTLTIGSNSYTQNGLYVNTFTAINGCDSIVQTDLTVLSPTATQNNHIICDGESIIVGSNTYSNPGLYIDTFISINGCDSVINTSLTVLPTYDIHNNVEICNNDSIVVGNNTYTQSGIYIDSLLSNYLCDSIINTQVTVSNIYGQIITTGNSLTVTAFNGIVPFTYYIYGPNGLIVTSQNNNGTALSINPTINGLYSFIATDALGCSSDTVFVTIDFAIQVNEFYFADSEILDVYDVLGRKVENHLNKMLLIKHRNGRVSKGMILTQ